MSENRNCHSAGLKGSAESTVPRSGRNSGTVAGRDEFIANLKKHKQFSPAYTDYLPINDLPTKTLAAKSIDELIEIAATRASEVFATFITCSKPQLAQVIGKAIAECGGGQVMIPTDNRFTEFGLKPQGEPLVTWLPGRENREANLANAANSNVAVAFADLFAAESCSSVVISGPGQGRALHFLPKHYISIVPASIIVPRTTGVAALLSRYDEESQPEGRAVHFISGPSNSADIELELVVGLHGPLSVTYLIVTDA